MNKKKSPRGRKLRIPGYKKMKSNRSGIFFGSLTRVTEVLMI